MTHGDGKARPQPVWPGSLWFRAQARFWRRQRVEEKRGMYFAFISPQAFSLQRRVTSRVNLRATLRRGFEENRRAETLTAWRDSTPRAIFHRYRRYARMSFSPFPPREPQLERPLLAPSPSAFAHDHPTETRYASFTRGCFAPFSSGCARVV